MKNNKFSNEELSKLCHFFLEGKLTREEEKALGLILSQRSSLSEECKSVLKIIASEAKIYKRPYHRKRRILRISGMAAAAAAVLALIAVALPYRDNINRADENERFVVLQEGKMITGEEARKLNEERQRLDMEMVRQVMRQQRELMKQNFAYTNIEDYDF